jgi:hypothetical protein
MTPKQQAELQCKRYRLFYNKIDGSVMGLASGGGAMESLTGDALILATYSNMLVDDAPVDPLSIVGCLEVFFQPLDKVAPFAVDLTLIQHCHQTVHDYQVARKEVDDTVFETGVRLTGGEAPLPILEKVLKVKEILSPDDDVINGIRVHLHEKVTECDSCAVAVLEARDRAVTFRNPPEDVVSDSL